jgi:hypothetical protein
MNSISLLRALFRAITSRRSASHRSARRALLDVGVLEMRDVPASQASPLAAVPLPRDIPLATVQTGGSVADVRAASDSTLLNVVPLATNTLVSAVNVPSADGIPVDEADTSEQDMSVAEAGTLDLSASGNAIDEEGVPAEFIVRTFAQWAEEPVDGPPPTEEPSPDPSDVVAEWRFGLGDEEDIVPPTLPVIAPGGTAVQTPQGSETARYAATAIAPMAPSPLVGLGSFSRTEAPTAERIEPMLVEAPISDLPVETNIELNRLGLPPAPVADTAPRTDVSPSPGSLAGLPVVPCRADFVTPVNPPGPLLAWQAVQTDVSDAVYGDSGLPSLLCSAGLALSSAAVAAAEFWRTRLTRRVRQADEPTAIPSVTGPRELM